MKIRFFTIPNLLTLANLLCGTGAAAAVLFLAFCAWVRYLDIKKKKRRMAMARRRRRRYARYAMERDPHPSRRRRRR